MNPMKSKSRLSTCAAENDVPEDPANEGGYVVGYDVAAIGQDGPVGRRSYDTSFPTKVKFHGLPGKRPVTRGRTRKGPSRPTNA